MATIQLGFGHGSIDFDYDDARFDVLSPAESESGLTDSEIGQAIETPIASRALEDLIQSGDTVLIVTSDATRATGGAQIINLLVRRLIQTGIAPSDIAIIFATGIHRPVTREEKLELLTPFIAERIRTIDHDADAAANLVEIGTSQRGTPVEVNRALKDFSKVILTGAVGFHYFAGFTGGRKAICPGLASAQTISETHMLAMDFDRGGRRAGVGAGILTGNAVSDECERIAALIDPAFIVNSIVNERGLPQRVFAGHWRAAHRRACETYAAGHSQTIDEKREVVIVSCGGAPYDINMIQAHKALDMAAHACNEGGTIVLLAECPDGHGRNDFLKWFESVDSRSLESRLQAAYEVNGQTAWALLTKIERFRVRIITQIGRDELRRMRMIPFGSLDQALSDLSTNAAGYIMPRGAASLPVIH